MKNKRDAVIIAYGRSPLAKAFKGSLATVHPVEYAAQTLQGVLKKLPGLDYALIDDVLVGCAFPEKYCGFNIARQIVKRAGLPDEVSGQTVNRFCSSGLQTVATAANAIISGEMDIVVAGGVEMMTNLYMGHPEEYQHPLVSKNSPGIYMSMGVTAENVADSFGISRVEMDQWAVESHRKAAQARAAGKFDAEIIPMRESLESEEILFISDEGIRPETTLESLSSMKPCFKPEGTVTAATSSQMTDGASFMVLMARETAEAMGFKPIAKFVSFAVGGVSSEMMGIGPVVAIPKVMNKSGLKIEDMDVIELNEAFASQVIACVKELGLPLEKINPNGGAIALGHPLGATGSVLICKALSELKRTEGKYALISMCIGGGMGAAGIFEME